MHPKFRSLFFFLLIASCSFYACERKNDFGKELQIEPINPFIIIDENKIIEDEEFGNDTVRASLYIDNAETPLIKHATAWFQQDTLKVLIYEYNHHSMDEYFIEIYRGKYKIKYDYDYDGGDAHIARKIVPINSLLKLNSSDFKIGKEIKGYTEFYGQCLYGCPGDDQTQIKVKGYFKAVIVYKPKVDRSVNSNYTEREVEVK